MKVLMLLGLVGAAIYGALVLSSDLFRTIQQKMHSPGGASAIRVTASCVRGVLIFPP